MMVASLTTHVNFVSTTSPIVLVVVDYLTDVINKLLVTKQPF